MLLEVQDWKGLASELDIKIGDQNAISSNCRDNEAKCHRRSLVQNYCDAGGLAVEVVAENIAQALESMGHKKQANIIKNMFPAGGKSTGKFSPSHFFNPSSYTGNERPHSERVSKQPHARNSEGEPSNGEQAPHHDDL